MEMEKLLEELLEEVKELSEKGTGKVKVEVKKGSKSKITKTEKEKKEYFDSQRKDIKRKACEIIDSCETCFVAIGDCGISGNGTPVDILALLFSGIADQIERNDIPKNIIENCCEEIIGLCNEEE